jgi:predicted nucleotidyltransferase
MFMINTLMRINEVIDTSIPYHDILNPKLWNEHVMRGVVRRKLEEIANEFIEYLKLPTLNVTNIVLTGSLANYNWSKYSDIDLHVIIESPTEVDGAILEDYLAAKQRVWNLTHDVTIFGYDVELYVEIEGEPHHSSGVYSIQDDEWVKEPSNGEPDIDRVTIKNKVHNIAGKLSLIDGVCQNKGKLEKIKDKIKDMRQAGLDRGGEFSTENLVYKVLRNNGYIDLLYDKINASVDNCLSL